MNRTSARARVAVCPDCDADYRMTPEDGVLVVTVLHDPACAWLNAAEQPPARNPRKEQQP